MAEQQDSIQDDQPIASANFVASGCNICNEPMTEGQDCLVISQCLHSFHRDCIERHLATSAQCPVCQHPCQLNELRTYVVTPKRPPMAKQSKRGKGRGAMARTYNTRSASRNLFQDVPNMSFDNGANPSTEPQQSPNPPNSLGNGNIVLSPFTNNNNPTPVIDYGEINRMIETNLTRILQNLNVLPNPIRNLSNVNLQTNNTNNVGNNNTNFNPNIPLNHSVNIPNQNLHNNQNVISNANHHENLNIPHTIPVQQPFNDQNSYVLPNASSSNNLPADKVTSIINNWHLKFDGSSNGHTIDEFLYRVKTLTNETLNGDFSLICKNLNTILSGKAREWYWRYHKSVQTITWEEFCKDIRGQYKDMKSSFDLREELRNRKQKSGESYDNFFDALCMIADRLPKPLSEVEFVEIIARNLRPEIRQDLLYVPVYSLSHLRKLVQMRENFLSDEYVRRTLVQRHQNPNPFPRKMVAEVGQEDHGPESESELHIEALQRSESNYKCWNCDNLGHHWQDCLESRTVFCYGCGAKNIYKPQCVKCISRMQSSSKNVRTVGPPKDQVFPRDPQ